MYSVMHNASGVTRFLVCQIYSVEGSKIIKIRSPFQVCYQLFEASSFLNLLFIMHGNTVHDLTKNHAFFFITLIKITCMSSSPDVVLYTLKQEVLIACLRSCRSSTISQYHLKFLKDQHVWVLLSLLKSSACLWTPIGEPTHLHTGASVAQLVKQSSTNHWVGGQCSHVNQNNWSLCNVIHKHTK